MTCNIKSGPDPIKKIYSVNLCYAGSEHPDWLKIWSNQSECLKISQKFMLKIYATLVLSTLIGWKI